jgi:hypothetical protein
MEQKNIRKYKLFGAWNDDKEEAWLSGMARQGLHLHSLGFPGIYNFTAGEPREDVYRLDFITDRKDYQNYLQLFKDAGWEHMGEMGGWQYFRTRKPREPGTRDLYRQCLQGPKIYPLVNLPFGFPAHLCNDGHSTGTWRGQPVGILCCHQIHLQSFLDILCICHHTHLKAHHTIEEKMISHFRYWFHRANEFDRITI